MLAEQLAIVVDGGLAHATVATVDRDTPGRIARTLIEAARPRLMRSATTSARGGGSIGPREGGPTVVDIGAT